MPTPPAEILTTFQKELLKYIGSSPLGKRFFLTGGTALAACYLHHRLSEDIDLFTEEPNAVAQALPVIQAAPQNLASRIEVSRTFETFLEVFVVSPNGERVKVDFAQDTPFRLKPIESSPWGIRVDNPLDISCNKLSALFGRAAAKDFVDIYFVVRQLYSFEQLLGEAQKKHVGLDNYWLAIAFQQVEKIDQWPMMKATCDFEDLKSFFLSQARELLKPR